MGEIAEVTGGGTPDTKTAAYWNGGTVPWITPADLSGYREKYISRGARNITEEGLAHSGARLLPAGTVLMSSRAPVGYVAVAANAVTTNQGFKSFVLRDGLLADYVYWYLIGNQELVSSFASGTTFPEVSGRRAAEIPIAVPPLAEQRRIVAALEEHLSDLDAAVAGLERARRNLVRFRESVLRESIESITAEAVPFSELLASLRNGISTKPEGETGLRILRISAVRPLRVDVGNVRYLSAAEPHYSEFVLEQGDLLFTRYNGNPALVGACGIVGALPAATVYPDKLIRARLRREHADPRFVQIVMSTGVSRAFIQSRVKTTAGQAGIAGGDLKLVPVPLPPLKIQLQVAAQVESRLAAADQAACEIDVQLARAVRLRQSILKRAFEGKLVLQNPNEEPADALLARIRTQRDATPTRRAPRRRGPPTH